MQPDDKTGREIRGSNAGATAKGTWEWVNTGMNDG